MEYRLPLEEQLRKVPRKIEQAAREFYDGSLAMDSGYDTTKLAEYEECSIFAKLFFRAIHFAQYRILDEKGIALDNPNQRNQALPQEWQIHDFANSLCQINSLQNYGRSIDFINYCRRESEIAGNSLKEVGFEKWRRLVIEYTTQRLLKLAKTIDEAIVRVKECPLAALDDKYSPPNMDVTHYNNAVRIIEEKYTKLKSKLDELDSTLKSSTTEEERDEAWIAKDRFLEFRE